MKVWGTSGNYDVMMYTISMHRTQILLEERQYAALKAWARRGDESLSGLIRQAVDRFLGTGTGKKSGAGLRDMRGLGSDPGGPSGRDHDRFLYGGAG